MGSMLDELNAVGTARASLKSDNIRDGRGRLMVEECIYEKMNEGRTWVTRFEVVSAESKGDTDKEGKAIVPNAAGSHVGWVQKTEKHKSAPGNVKAFVLALLGFSEAEVDAQPGAFGKAADELRSKLQPGRGMFIDFETYRQTTQTGPNAGKVNTYTRFMHVGVGAGNDAKAIAERRTALDVKSPLSK